MLELSGMGSVLRGIGILYWLLAIGVVGLAVWKGRNWQRKALWAAIAVAVFGFLPAKAVIEQYQRNVYAREAWAYFKKLCDEKSGEKIYKTFTGVKSVLVVKPLPPATEKDLYDQFWYGDPYSNATPWNERGEQSAIRMTGIFKSTTGDQNGLEFVEIPGDDKGKYFYRLKSLDRYPYQTRSGTENVTSRFGVSWEDVSTPQDRKYWVASSRLRVVDLSDNSIVAERIGYFIEAGFGSTGGGRRPWLTSRGPSTTCPPISNGDYEDRWFVLKSLIPTERMQDGK